MKKLLLAGSNTIHTYNYYQLVHDLFDTVHIVTDRQTDLFEQLSHDYVDFSLKRIHRIKPTIKFIRNIIHGFQPDVIHIQQAGTEAWMVLKAASGLNIPVIVTAWGSDILLIPDRGRMFRKMTGYILENANAFTCDSAYVATRMQELSGKWDLKIRIANFGIEPDTRVHKKENIIYSNRLHKKLYRIDRIIEGFKLFMEQRTGENWKLVIAGEGDETERLRTLAEDLSIQEHTLFTGWLDRERNLEYYRKARIFVSIPESDATSISLLEAMASGCIPVLSNLPANHEWVIDGLNGTIVTDFSGNFLEEALELDEGILMDINKELIEKKGSKEANKKIFLSLYEEVLKT